MHWQQASTVLLAGMLSLSSKTSHRGMSQFHDVPHSNRHPALSCEEGKAKPWAGPCTFDQLWLDPQKNQLRKGLSLGFCFLKQDLSPCSPSWPGTRYTDQAGLKCVEMLLPPPPGSWGYRCPPPHVATAKKFWTWPRTGTRGLRS